MSEIENDNKLLATREFEAALSHRRAILEEHSASFRWLMASMLAINGGGLLKLSDVTLSHMGELLASASFFVGIWAALAVAWLGQVSSRKVIAPLSEVASFWSVVSVNGDFDTDKHAEIMARVFDAAKSGKWPRIAGWLSVLAFSVGAVTMMASHDHREQAVQVSQLQQQPTARHR